MDLQIFKSPEFGTVRIVSLNDGPWFIGKDVAEILGYSNTNKAIQMHVDKEDKFLRSERGTELGKLFSTVKKMQEEMGRQDNWFINESGVYSLIFGSKLPNAKKFKRWVTSEVLPAIRKTGGYIPHDEVMRKSWPKPFRFPREPSKNSTGKSGPWKSKRAICR